MLKEIIENIEGKGVAPIIISFNQQQIQIQGFFPTTHLTNPKMAPAFVPGPAVTARTFSGARLRKCAASTGTVRMSTPSVSRRQALAAAAALLGGAALTPLSALAKAGTSPSISVFGVGGMSSPFASGVQKGGTVLYKTFGPDEVAVFERIVRESKDRLESASGAIKIKSWDDVRSKIRLEAADLRKTQITIMSNLQDPDQVATAQKAYKTFKQDIEALDAACVQKNQNRAYKAYNASLKSLTAWQSAAGF